MTALHRELAPDQLHADGCRADAPAMAAAGAEFVTVLAYPHEVPRVRATTMAMALSLRIAPRGHREAFWRPPALWHTLCGPCVALRQAWAAGWGGHTEFAAKRCGDREMRDAAAGAATPAVLAVSPLAGRTVVFNGGLLHRATHPTAAAGVAVAGQPPGQRYSSVMQLVCFRVGFNATAGAV